MIDPLSPETSGYHLFFEPAGEASVRLADTIEKLSEEYGGPLFAPHLTLLAAIPETNEEELVHMSHTLALNLQPFTLTLEGFGAEDAYFRTLYMTVRNRDEVVRYHAIAREVFGGVDASEYLPHVSLLYGLYDTERKQESIASLQALSPLSFEVGSLTLWHTPGAAHTWRRIGEFPVGQQGTV